jgi:hypothetical protein
VQNDLALDEPGLGSRRPARDGSRHQAARVEPLQRNRQPPAGSTDLSDDLQTFAATRSAPTPTSLPLAAQSDHATDESVARLLRTTSDKADRPCADACFGLGKQASEQASPARLVLVTEARRASR